MARVHGYRGKLIVKFVQFDMNKPQAFAFRRVLGLEPKNRQRVAVYLEKEILEAVRESDIMPGRAGVLSDLINQSMSIYLAAHGYLNDTGKEVKIPL
jgi:hypothetical protein